MSARPGVLDRCIFAPAPPERLAALRILVGAYALGYVHRRRQMLRRVAGGDERFFTPVGVVSPLVRPLSPSAFGALLNATEVANVAFVLGARHRVSGPLFGASLLVLLTYRNSWSMIYHNDNVLVLHALVLGMAPAADALSLDALVRARPGPRGRRRGERYRRAAASWRYGWPIQLMNALTAATYFLAAVAKLKGPLGRRWTSGESLRGHVAVDGVRKELLGEAASPLAYRLFGQIHLFRALATASLVIEASAPVLLVDRRSARVWALSAFGMHWGIYALMKIKFRYQMAGVAFAPFFAVEQALTTWRVPLRRLSDCGVGRLPGLRATRALRRP